MTAPQALTLDTVFNETNPACKPLRDGTVHIQGLEMWHIPVPNMIVPFRRMSRNAEFDLSELALVCYFVARRYGLPFTAIPVFPLARVDYGQGISINTRYARTAKDLEGKRVGMRAYTVTATTRQAMYLEERGCDLSKVTWVSNDVEHVKQFHPDAPANVEYNKGADLKQMLVDGEIAAAFSVEAPENPEIVPLNPSFREHGIERFQADHIYHLIHTIVVHNRVLEGNPWLLRAVYDGFKESKQAWLSQREGGAPDPWDDPLPLGLSEVRPSLENLMQQVVKLGILEEPMDIDALFPGKFE